MLTFFIETVRGVMHIMDSIITPASMLFTLSRVNGIEAFTFYFYCDLPISFRQSIFLQDSIRLQKADNFENQNIDALLDNYLFFRCINSNIYATDLNLINTFTTFTITKCFYYDYITAPITNFINNISCRFKNPFLVYNYFSNKNEFISIAKHYAFAPIIIDMSYFLWFLKPLATKLNTFCSDHIVTILDMMVSSVFFLFFFLFFFKFFVKVVRSLSANAFTIQKLKKKVDQEVSSLEDILAFVIFFSVFFINNLNLYTPSQLVEYNIHITFWALFICFYFLVVLLPLNLLFTVGGAGFMYIKGSDKNNSLAAYIILDTVVVLSFLLRFLLQVIRWCLFLTTYYLLHEFVFEWTYNLFTYVMYSLNFSNEVGYFKTNNIFINFFIQFIRYAFEIFDTCLILTIQITAFVAVILWLFNYLFSISLDDIYEIVFEDKIIL